MKRKTLIILLLVFICSMTFVFCGEENKDIDNINKDEAITIKITRNNGNEIIDKRVIPYKEGRTVMDIMATNYDIETTFGGAFIKSIEGIASKTKKGAKSGFDWFYYVNGKEADYGANNYMPKKGDTIHWDFHKWKLDELTNTD